MRQLIRQSWQGLVLCLLLTLPAGCYNDDTLSGLGQYADVLDKLNDHEERLAALEQWQKQMNDNMAALQQLINTTDCITAVAPIEQGGEVIGYTITFRYSDPIALYNGKKGDKGDPGQDGQDGEDGADGQDGEDGRDAPLPLISITQGTDGNWYWTLNGELILDDKGNPVRANGEKGSDGTQGTPGVPGTPGQSAPTPQVYTGSYLSTNLGTATDAEGNALVSDAIYLSVDGGATWHRISGEKGDTGDTGATGPQGDKGDSMFSQEPQVDTDNGCVVFYLANGESFTVPLYVAMSITFADETFFAPAPGESVEMTIRVTGETANTSLQVIAPEGWATELKDTDEKGLYTLTLTAPANSLLQRGADWSGRLFVTMTDGHGSSTLAEADIYCTRFVIDTETSISGGSYNYRGRTLQMGINEDGKPVMLAESSPIGIDGLARVGSNYLRDVKPGDKVWFCIPGVVKFFHTLTAAEVTDGTITLPDKDKGSTLLADGYTNDWIVALYMGTNKGGFTNQTGTPATNIPLYFASGNLIATKTNASGQSTVASFHIATYDETMEEAKTRGSAFNVSQGLSLSDTDGFTNVAQSSKWDLFPWGDPTGLKVIATPTGGNYDMGLTGDTHISTNPQYDLCRAQLGGTWRLPAQTSTYQNELVAFMDGTSTNPGYSIDPMAEKWVASDGSTFQGMSFAYIIPTVTNGTEITNTLYFPATGNRDNTSYLSRGQSASYWTDFASATWPLCFYYNMYFSEKMLGSIGSMSGGQVGNPIRPVTE